ncbi:lipocalin family protein [Chitinophaga sp. S165]|uniref:lipocalin family protein n=1 Tax=Chitinophaga sp. S165 TaxID=2135462 RepID=UPI000D8D5088|nr:lipocalin family protein [Chitinophaga sp. S165]PWV47011.1 lipocalin-like protein [Chitinophaga sp. S165]
MNRYFILLIAMLSGKITQSYAQNNPVPFTDMISKEWKLEFYGENGKKQPPSPQQQKSRMIFSKDNKVLSIENGKKEQGSWQYDSSKKLLTINKQTGEQLLLQVIKLDQERFVAGYQDPAGVVLEIHMQSVRK